ncbi:MAG: hypothetical protein FWD69_08755 [Polyangiaceae bacterium]|nr:hypothetical protein [Polyangiaceae bacterium]
MCSLRFFFAGSVAVAFGIVTACSLGLDESLIEGDAGGNGPGTPDSMVDSGDSNAPSGLERKPCTLDTDCPSTAVLTGRCDLGLPWPPSPGTCAYDVCGVQDAGACSARTYTDAGCSASIVQHSYKAAMFKLPSDMGDIGCGGAASPGAANRCFAAVYPFFFVGTQNGVRAFSAKNALTPDNTGLATPLEVPVTGLSFIPNPTQIFASGSRVFFIGPMESSTSMPIGWLDVPVDPLAKELVANAVLANWATSPGDGGAAGFPRVDPSSNPPESYTALLVSLVPSAQGDFSVAALVPSEPLDLKATSVSPPSVAGTADAGMITSGKRLVIDRITSGVTAPNMAATFRVYNDVGVNGLIAVTPDIPFQMNTGSVPLPQSFAASPGGAVFWSVAVASGANLANASGVQGFFLTTDGNTAIDSNANPVTIETYSSIVPIDANKGIIVGPAAMLDNDTAIVTAGTMLNGSTPNQTSVQFVKRDPNGFVLPSLVPSNASPHRDVLTNVTVDKVGVAASHGMGYVLIANVTVANPLTTTLQVNVYDPNCN